MSTEEQNILILIVSATVILLLLATFIVLFLFVYQKRVDKHKRHVQKIQEDFKNEMVSSKMELQEQTLTSVSEEMHDNLGQMLSVIKLNLIKLGRMAAHNEKEAEVVEELKDQVSGVINDIRNISKTLSKDFIANFGLAESLSLEIDKINRTDEIEAVLKVKGIDELHLDGQSQIVLFRIAQEVINNALKHADAAKIVVGLNYEPDGLFMTIEDDGKGFNVEETTINGSTNRGRGLRNMQNRVKIIGGVLNLTSNIGKGTKATITIDTQSSLYLNSKKQ